MRRRSAALTAVVGAAALAASWRVGSTTSTADAALPAGVQVVSPVQDTTPAATATPSATSPTAAGRAAARTASPPVVTRAIRGALVSTPYGDVQVRATVRGTRLLDVTAVRLTDANGTSRSISAAAAPVLRREALTAGSARIDTVTGATYTSAGYRASLQAALDAAAR